MLWFEPQVVRTFQTSTVHTQLIGGVPLYMYELVKSLSQYVRGDLRLSKGGKRVSGPSPKKQPPTTCRRNTRSLGQFFQQEWPNEGTLETLHAQHHSPCGGVIRAGSPPQQLRLSGCPSWYTNPTSLGGVVEDPNWLRCGGWTFVHMCICGAYRAAPGLPRGRQCMSLSAAASLLLVKNSRDP